MRDTSHTEGPAERAGAPDNERLIQVLSLEYQTLRDEILTRTSGRFQFLGLMTTAAALLASGIGVSHVGLGVWASAALAIAAFSLGLGYFGGLGIHIIRISARLAQLEARINNLLAVQDDGQRALSWESEKQKRTLIARIALGDFLRKR
jgi:uncharacterized membrane protein YhiD involved in acid resistance